MFPWRRWLQAIGTGVLAEIRDEISVATPELLTMRASSVAGEPYGRRPLFRDDGGEVMLAAWTPGAECAPHDHAGARGAVLVLAGRFVETEWLWRDGDLRRGRSRPWRAGDVIPVEPGGIHSMLDEDGGASLHFYVPPIAGMRVFDARLRQTLTVRDDCGAWLPSDPNLILSRQPWTTTGR